MKNRNLALLLTVCLLGATLSGCSGSNSSSGTDDSDSQTSENSDYHFNIIVQSFQSTYWQAAVTGIDQASEEFGVSVDCTGPNSESDIADQVNMLNNAISSKPDGIAIAPCDQNAVFDSLESALENEIPVICFDSGVESAPEGSVYCTIASDNYASGEIAGENLYEGLKDTIAEADSAVRIGEVNQESTSESISNRGLGFIDKFASLAVADGYKVAVTGNDFFINNCNVEMSDESEADIIIEVGVPTQTTVELCATVASNIMNKPDTIAIFGSNQTAAEGILTANSNLQVLGNTPGESIIAVGFDAGATIKEAVRSGTMYGAITQSPVEMGYLTVETLYKIAQGEEVEDISTDCYWYDAENMDDEEIAPNLYD
ncbi:MAG TPA: substrate-binding domain-containing protein [Candidatus Mediterraneibacter colneyensis]|nr:substrate-binding domain-containing protein [Candidatus Mediterraneibacter colneyensis]